MRSRPGLDRDVVVRAAADLYDTAGGRDVTMKDVASHLGVKTPSLYNHIAGQDDLIRGLAVYGVRKLDAVISHAAIGKSGDEAVLAVAHAYRQFAHQHPGLYRLTQRAPEPDDDELLAASQDTLHTLHLVLLEYGLDPRVEVHAIRGLRSLVHGFVSLEISGGFGMPVNIDESFRVLLNMFIRGLHSTDTTRPPASEVKTSAGGLS
jgi:AcrR family transcriptional regulator